MSASQRNRLRAQLSGRQQQAMDAMPFPTGSSSRARPTSLSDQMDRVTRSTSSTLMLHRPPTRSASPTSTATASSSRRTSAGSTVSTAATSVSSGPPPPPLPLAAVTMAEKQEVKREMNRQKQQRYRDRIQDTISTLKSDNTRLLQENVELQERVAELTMQNAALSSSSSTTAGEGEEDVIGGEQDEQMENVDGQLDGGESVGEIEDLSTDETPLVQSSANPWDGAYNSLTPPTSIGEAPPAAPTLERVPFFDPDDERGLPTYPGLLANSTAQGHYLFRIDAPKTTFSGAPSPMLPLVKDIGSDKEMIVLGNTPSNVLGLRFDSPYSANPFSSFAGPLLDVPVKTSPRNIEMRSEVTSGVGMGHSTPHFQQWSFRH